MPAKVPPSKPASVHRLHLRASSAQRRVIHHAAAAAGMSVNSFVLDTVCAAAYQQVAARLDIPLDDPDWDHFLGLLGQPGTSRGELQALLYEEHRTDGH